MIDYPRTRTVEQVDDNHDTKVPNPYRWLEDLDAPETVEWVAAQDRVTFSHLERSRFATGCARA